MAAEGFETMGLLAVTLGNWWVFAVVTAMTSVVFGHMVPQAKAPIFVRAAPTVPRKLLDEYVWTWTPAVAERLFSGIGAEGRFACRQFHSTISFWLPPPLTALTNASLLLLAFPATGSICALSLVLLVLGVAENLAQVALAGSYPAMSPRALRLGPAVTRLKWLAALAIVALAAIGFASQLVQANWSDG